MDSAFLKFKRKTVVDALIKSLIIGISLGLMAFGALFLLSKREVIGLHLAFCILIGVGVALVGGGLSFWLFVPNDKRLAKRLDKELSLNEKVQTMVSFQNEDREMVALQRQDTEEKLQNVPIKALSFGKIWKYIVTGAIAVAMFITSLAVPAVKRIEADTPFDLTNWQKIRVQNVIKYVEDSTLVDSAKTYTVEQLNGLVVALDSVTTQNVMKTHVIQVIVNVDAKIDDVNSYGNIRKKLGDTGTTDLIKLANALQSLQASASVQAFTELRPLFTYTTFADTVVLFNGQVTASLVHSGYDGNDALYASIFRFMNELKTYADNITDYTESTLDKALNGTNGVGGLFTEFAVEAHDALAQQKTNRRVCDYVMDELMGIFSITQDELPDLGEEELDYKIDDEDSDGRDEKPDDGGLGDGETEYGSKDTVYDNEKGYVEYGEVLDKYFAKMNEQLLNGTLPKEAEDFIRDYFASLYGVGEQ